MSPDEVAKLMRQLVEFEKGEHARMKEGAFAGSAGAVDVVNPERGLVRVIVSVFSRPTPIDFECWKIERAEA